VLSGPQVNSPTWVQRQAVPEFGTVADIVGVIMWVIGFSTEALADRQKFSFRMQPQNSGRFCSVGESRRIEK
jgi:steroid 5-alpha reductase family enzyme